MTRPPRTLREAVAIAPEAAPAADPFGAENADDNEADAVARLGILVRVNPEIRKQLKLLAIDRGTSVQALLLDAISIVLDLHDDEPAPGRRNGP